MRGGRGGSGPGGSAGADPEVSGGLTTRGRSFVAAGVACAACAYLLGQSDLLKVGLLLAVLPLVCAVVLRWQRHSVAGGRLLEPARVAAATEARVRVWVANEARVPTGLLMVQDQVPYALGPRPRFVLPRVEAGGRREVAYRVRAEVRGRYALGPLQLRLADPFGMCELTRPLGPVDTLTVVPRVVPLPALPLSGAVTGRGDGVGRQSALSGEDDVIPRGYRRGDDLRRVHWRSTARHGELMVRREESPRTTRGTVLLDTRAAAFLTSGADSAFEWAVSGAASAAVHLLERGFAVQLVTDSGADASGGAGGRPPAEAAGRLLDALALVGRSENRGLERAHEALAGGGGLLVAFLGELDEEQVAVVARMRGRAADAVAFLLDEESWAAETGAGGTGTPGGPAGTEVDRRLRTLQENGWRAVRVRAGDTPAEAWRAVAVAGATGPGPLPGAAGGEVPGPDAGADAASEALRVGGAGAPGGPVPPAGGSERAS
ncbi:DUF58 domain-containing protein [Streptomyces sp. NPDC059740]|uniref:DUF58 domain-containing protein n=1 Tax=Streptomyces sp. NPDC059740 TaxID=3346926 RepID=UPI003650A64D